VIHAIDRTGALAVVSIARKETPPAYWVWTEGAASPERRSAETVDL
jgi:hypothetical protein